MAFLLDQGRSAEDHPFVDQAIIADLAGFSNHDPHAMVDEEASPDLSAGMDLDPRKPTADV
jgi:hypothetical protein